MGYIDLHTHTKLSDGRLSAEELILEAKKNQIEILAITDHNRMLPIEEFERLEKLAAPEIKLIRGSEVSCSYWAGEELVELHVVALFLDKYSVKESFFKVLEKNVSYSREPYIRAMLKKLEEVGFYLTYEELLEMYPDTYIARSQIAGALVKKGYVKTVEEALDEYIGNCGKRRAWVPNENKKYICKLEEVIDVIRESQGLAILAHLYYYRLNEVNQHILLRTFKEKAGVIGGTEVEYQKYDTEQRKKMKELAEQYDLFPSSASDYHAVMETDSLNNRFSCDILEKMMECWKAEYGREL